MGPKQAQRQTTNQERCWNFRHTGRLGVEGVYGDQEQTLTVRWLPKGNRGGTR
jgi:hypothetical protein